MVDELFKRYMETGIVHCPVGEYKRLKHKLDAVGEKYDCSWDNSFQRYVFETKRGTLV